MRRRDPDADALKRHVLAMSAAYRVATRTLGAYRYEDRSLLVIPESAERLGRAQGWSVQTRERVIRLAAAHELVHALQDQTTDVRTRIADVRGDQLTALIAVLEGQAILVTDQLAAELAWQSAGSALFRLVAPEESPGGRPDPQAPPVTRLAPTASTYRLGAEFIRNEYAQGGIDRVWALVADPPREVSSIGQLSPKETPGSGP